MTITELERAMVLSSCTVLFLCASLTASVHARVQSESKWARYNGQDDEFSCLLPERPAAHLKLRPKLASEQKPPSGTAEERGRIYGAYSNGVVYVIMSFDRHGSQQLEELVEEFRKYHRPKAEMTFVRDVTKNEVVGKQYRINLSGVNGVTHFYSTKKHFYILQAVGGNESHPGVRRFLMSFTLNGIVPIENFAEQSNEVQTSSIHDVTPSPNEALISDEVFSSKDVTRKALVVMRPEPLFPRPGYIQGRIRIKAVLSATGKVETIDVVEGRKNTNALTLEAVRNIKFIPAVKDGKFVSQYIIFEFQFHTYR